MSSPKDGNPEITADEVVADIEQTREEMGETIDALADKLNPKHAAQHGVDAAKAAVTDDSGRVEPDLAAAVAAVVVMVVATLVLRGRRW
jgi:hypothetical protein